MRFSFLAAVICALGASSASEGAVRFVKFNATGTNNGTSWANAYTDLRTALVAAVAGDDIWVAAGTYKPATPSTPNPRTLSFPMKTGVRIIGGFAGTETAAGQRDAVANLTILSGDINGDDTPNFGNRADNSFHVVSAVNVGGRLDGFTIRGGNANATGDDAFGGGVLVRSFATTLFANCIIRDNTANRGAGLASSGASPTADQCLFTGNRGGSVGAIDVQNSGQARLYGCTIAANHTNFTSGGAVSFLNTTQGGVVEGCILWGNTNLGGTVQSAQFVRSNAGPLSVTLCDVEGGTAGLGFGCFSADPLFESPLGVDGTPNTGDEDFRLGSGSPCIDRLSAGNMLFDTFDEDGDSITNEPIPVDIAWDNRNYDDPNTPNAVSVTFDLGPYEFQGISCPGDMDGNLVVNTIDLTLFLGAFGQSGAPMRPGDFDGDGNVNTADLVIFLGNFGVSCAL